MLKHGHKTPVKPDRVVIVGAAGFIGGAIAMATRAAGIPTLTISRTEVDLLSSDAAGRLASYFKPTDSIVAAAAIAPVKTTAMLADNLALVSNLLFALKESPVAHVVNISSDAVFADGPLPLIESSTRAPESLHGAMHLARELAFAVEVAVPVATLRPTLVYGPGDPHNGYGPNRFRRLANAGTDIVLFGNGEERRDHVYIDDVAALALRILLRRSEGSLNAATGEVHSFKEIAEMSVRLAGGTAVIKTSPRNGPMPHGGFRPFDPVACSAAFPDFAFTSLADGMALAQQQEVSALRNAG